MTALSTILQKEETLCPLTALGQQVTESLSTSDGDLTLVEKLLTECLQSINPADLPTLSVEKGTYERELRYKDPLGRFTILVLHWGVNAKTPVHGHNTWGAVGLFDGSLECICFDKQHLNDGAFQLTQKSHVTITPGMTACVNPDPEGIHCLQNTSDAPARSIHIYGMDLTIDPTAVNVNYE